jgi:hypothetical protein
MVGKGMDEDRGSTFDYVIPWLNIQPPIFLWIPEIFMNKHPEIKTHAYMQAWLIFQVCFFAFIAGPHKTTGNRNN